MTAAPETTAPRYRHFPVRVVRTQRLGPTFVRVTFTGHELAGFGAAGDDQRIKVLLPAPGRAVVEVPRGDDWYDAWLATPEADRPVLRTYTVRASRPAAREVDVDFVLHAEHPGPASSWAAAAEPGDHLVLLGPDRPGTGRAWGVEWAPPVGVRTLLVVGDETAVPAVAAVLEGLSDDATGTVLLEVPTAADAQPLVAPAGVAVHWLARDGAACGALLLPAVRAATAGWGGTGRGGVRRVEVVEVVEEATDDDIVWDVPEDPRGAEVYAWLAGEAGVVKQLRRLLVGERAVPKHAVAFMGYWREGRTL